MALKPVAKVSWTAEPRCPDGWSDAEWGQELVRRGYSSHGSGGYLPQGLFTVKVYSAAMRKSWYQAKLHTGVVVVETIPIGVEDGRPAKLVCRVVGSAEQLDSLMCYPCVELAEHVMSRRVPMGEKCDEGGIPYVLKVTAQGAGVPKPRPKPSNTMVVAAPQQHTDTVEGHTLSARTGISTKYQDVHPKKPTPCGSATEYESLVEARKASDHTNRPTTSA